MKSWPASYCRWATTKNLLWKNNLNVLLFLPRGRKKPVRAVPVRPQAKKLAPGERPGTEARGMVHLHLVSRSTISRGANPGLAALKASAMASFSWGSTLQVA